MTSSIVQEAPTLRCGWRTVRLGSVCRVQNGFAFDSERFSRSKGTPLIRIRDLKTNAPGESYDGSFDQSYLVSAGDLLVGMDGEFRCYEWQGPLALLNQRVCRLIPDPSLLDGAFLRFAIAAHLQAIEDATAFTTVKHVSSRQILDIEFKLPPLPEQRRIAARLNQQMAEAASARTAAETQLKAIGSLLTASLRAAFDNIVPLSTGSSTATPSAWRWHRLLDFARLESGHTPSRKRPEWWGGEVPWLALPDIRRLDCREANETLERTNADGLANSSARLLPPGTVCLSRTASVGFVTILGREMATSQDFVNWICGPELDPWFLLWVLRASREFIRSQSTGAIHKTVYLPVAESFEICAPPLAEQQRIAARLRDQFAEIEHARAAAAAQLEAIAALPGAYLRAAFAQA